MINIDELDDVIKKTLEEYSADLKNAVNKSAEITSGEVVQVIKKSGDFKDKSGKYRKSWKVTKEMNIIGDLKCTVHAGSPHYRLTHLLEHGHAMPQGGRSKAYPHIKPAEDLAKVLFVKKVTDEIEKL